MDHIAPSNNHVAFASANLSTTPRARQPPDLALALSHILQYIDRLHNFQRVLADDQNRLVPSSYMDSCGPQILSRRIYHPSRCFRAWVTAVTHLTRAGRGSINLSRDWSTLRGVYYTAASHSLIARWPSHGNRLKHCSGTISRSLYCANARHTDSCLIYNMRFRSKPVVLMLEQAGSSSTLRA